MLAQEDMTQSSLDLSAPVPSSNSSETSEPESQASTGLGIHQHNWTRIETIGIPVFEFPEYDKVIMPHAIIVVCFPCLLLWRLLDLICFFCAPFPVVA